MAGIISGHCGLLNVRLIARISIFHIVYHPCELHSQLLRSLADRSGEFSGVSKNIISVMGMKVIQAAKNPFPPRQGWTGNGTQKQ